VHSLLRAWRAICIISSDDEGEDFVLCRLAAFILAMESWIRSGGAGKGKARKKLLWTALDVNFVT